MSFQDGNSVNIMNQFNSIFEQLQLLNKYKHVMGESKDGYKTDGGFSSGCIMQRQRFRMLCEQFKDSSEFKDFCTTNKEFRSNVYQYSLGHIVDEVVFGMYGDYLSCDYPLVSGTISETPAQVGCDYTVSWRGLFTCDTDVKTMPYCASEPYYDVNSPRVDANNMIYYKVIPKSNSCSPLDEDD